MEKKKARKNVPPERPQNTWVKCDCCDGLHLRGASLHKTENPADEKFNDLMNFTFPHIKEKSLFVDVYDEETAQEANFSPVCSVLLDRETMSLLQLTNNCIVQITSKDKKLLSHVRETNFDSPGKIKLTKSVAMNINSNNESVVLSIKKYTERVNPATKLNLTFEKDVCLKIEDDAVLKEFINFNLINCLIFDGFLCCFTFLNTKYTFSVNFPLLSNLKNMDIKNNLNEFAIADSTTQYNFTFDTPKQTSSLCMFESFKKQHKKLSNLLTLNHYCFKNNINNVLLPRSSLVHGPDGTGKTSLVKDILSNFYYSYIDCNVIKNLKKQISHAFKNENSNYIVIDNLHNICSAPEHSSLTDSFNEISLFLTEKILALTDVFTVENYKQKTFKYVICLLNKEKCDPNNILLQKSGIFDNEMQLELPNKQERIDILTHFLALQSIPNSLNIHEIDFLVDKTLNYSIVEIRMLLKHATSHYLHRMSANNSDLAIDDFLNGLLKVQPAAIKFYTPLDDSQLLRWDDIGGYADVKNQLAECVEWPVKFPEALLRMRLDPPNGVLLYGPPGCSKTMLARALAGGFAYDHLPDGTQLTRNKLRFISIKGPELVSMYVGETEKSIRNLFHKARSACPCILFFDEIDAIASSRSATNNSNSNLHNDRVIAQLLTEMDGINSSNVNLFVIAATNRPYSIDNALLRPKRFDRVIYVPLPDYEARLAIFKLNLQNVPVSHEVSLSHLAEATKNYSGAEITAICKEATYTALRKNIDCEFLTNEHFKSALTEIKPRVSPDSVVMYENFSKQIR